MANGARKLIWLCCGSLLLSPGTAIPQHRSPRVIQVKIAADAKFCIQDRWHLKASREIRRSFAHFEGPFGLQFEVGDFVYWSPGSPRNTILHFLNDLRKNSARDGCDIVIGIISQERLFDRPFGIASYFDGYIVVTDLKPKYPLEFLITHELAHMFGAVDLNEGASIMSLLQASYQFDEFTKRIIHLQRDRSFDPSLFPLSTTALDESIRLFKQRTESGLNEPGVQIKLAIMCSERKDYASAEDACLSLLESNPDLEGLHSTLGNIYLGQDEDDKAIEELLKELAVCPELPEVRCNLGLAYSKKGRVDEAIEQYQLALALDPNFAKAHADLGHLYLKKGVIDQAIIECRTALKNCPDIPETLCTLAAALILRHESAVSADFLEAGPGAAPEIAGIPKPPEVVEAIEEAMELCRKAISLQAGISEPHNILGIAYISQKNFPAAEAEFMRSVEISPDSPVAHFNLGLLYFNWGQSEKAAYHVRKIMDLEPPSELSRWMLGQLFQAQDGSSIILKHFKNAALKDQGKPSKNQPFIH